MYSPRQQQVLVSDVNVHTSWLHSLTRQQPSGRVKNLRSSQKSKFLDTLTHCIHFGQAVTNLCPLLSQPHQDLCVFLRGIKVRWCIKNDKISYLLDIRLRPQVCCCEITKYHTHFGYLKSLCGFIMRQFIFEISGHLFPNIYTLLPWYTMQMHLIKY